MWMLGCAVRGVVRVCIVHWMSTWAAVRAVENTQLGFWASLNMLIVNSAMQSNPRWRVMQTRLLWLALMVTPWFGYHRNTIMRVRH
ncbi:hypothetical protein BKA58DRAFT_22362 [Alternaria rosae]|uniref:uncharacterized protein n=1 Tax=Alternaria rosae TaxID=1187941 RepID=UPI001E8EEBBE|nr:uncharacterized protein BKA58DRAFT_22362 [Alternaria rosae]KAH6882625.1 hypothetical protein BKA58DRAFT_22362 [Alternaria rosae]